MVDTQSVVDPHARVERCAEKIPQKGIRENTGRVYWYPGRCSRWAKAGSDYCWQHAPRHEEKKL